MVTHNPELAEQYATRIVRLKDGVITDDTRPVEPDEVDTQTPVDRSDGPGVDELFHVAEFEL